MTIPGIRSETSPAGGMAWVVALRRRGRDLPDAPAQRAPDARALHLLHEGLTTASVAEGSSCTAVFDGTLFDRANDGRSSYSRSAGRGDAALVLREYLEHGEGMLRGLKGVFALVVWDGRHDLLLAARDPLGIYPLFYAEARGDILLSTSIEALIQHPDVSATVSRPMLADHLRHRSATLDETMFEAVRRVPPGHVMRLEGTRQRTRRYWDPAPPDRPVAWLDESEVDRFDEILERVVSRHLELGPSGIYLSGGLDSVSVAAAAAHLSRGNGLPMPLALSLIFPHPDSNEEEAQRAVAAEIDLPQIILPVEEAAGPDGLLEANLELNASWPAPIVNFWLPAYRRLAEEARRRGCRVILTGGGGDEWLSVGPLYAVDLLRRLHVGAYVRLWKALGASYRLSTFELLRSMWLYGPRSLIGTAARRVVGAITPEALSARRLKLNQRSIPAWLAPDPELRRAIGERIEFRGHEADRGHLGHYLAEGRRALDHPFISIEMEERFESGRRAGVIELHPYWDPELVDMLYRTPPELLLAGGRNKGLVRRTIADRFPKLGLERQKKSVSLAYFRSTLLREGRESWRSMGGVPALHALGVVDGPKVSSMIDGILDGGNLREAHRLWEVLGLEAWVRHRT